MHTVRAPAARARAQRVADWAEGERERHGTVAAVFDIVDRDLEVGGGIIAGALAYRLFIWLLPLGLVLVAGLGLAADAASRSPQQAAGSLALAGLVSASVATAAQSATRWYALLVGVPVLFLATGSVLRVLVGSHRLIWRMSKSDVPKPRMPATLRLLGLLFATLVVSAFTAWARTHAGGLGLLPILATAFGYTGIWLLVSLRLPHADAGWTALLPGAITFGLTIEILQALGVYVLAPYAASKQGTYGVLGLAAVLLVALFLIGRVMVGAAVVNATLWARRTTVPA